MKLINLMSLSIALLALVGMGNVVAAPDCGEDLDTFVVGINVGTNPLTASEVGFPPFEEIVNSLLRGSDIQIACQLARGLGFDKIVFKNFTNFSDLIPALNAGLITAIISDMSISGDNLEGANFVRYMNDTFGFTFVNQGNVPAGVTSANIINQLITTAKFAGYTFATTSGTREESILGKALAQNLANGFGGFTVNASANNVSQLPALAANVVYFLDDPTGFQLQKTNNGFVLDNATLNALEAGVDFSADQSSGLGVGVHKECCQVLKNIEKVLSDLVKNGFFVRLAADPAFNPDFKNALPSVPATFVDPAGACADVTENVPVRNAISQFILDKHCPVCITVPLADIEAGVLA